MIHIRIEPAAVELAVAPGETLLAAARRAGLAWRSVCGGHGQCRTCYFTTLEPEAFAPPSHLERTALALLAPTLLPQGEARLACQATPTKDAFVRKPGVRPVQPPAS